MKALQIETFGNPVEVVKVVDIPDVAAPAAGEVVIALEASPINQYDLLMIAGGYGYRPRLPAIMGTEGAGCVVAVGLAASESFEALILGSGHGGKLISSAVTREPWCEQRHAGEP